MKNYAIEGSPRGYNLCANEGKKIETILLNTARGVVLNPCLL
jgi:hypothetical protein